MAEPVRKISAGELRDGPSTPGMQRSEAVAILVVTRTGQGPSVINVEGPDA